MSGVLRRGSLNFAEHLNNKNSKRGSQDSNLAGGYRDSNTVIPEISLIALDFRNYSEDLKKNSEDLETGSSPEKMTHDRSQDMDSDEISNYIGHIGRWQCIWAFVISLFQIASTFHIFAFVFQTADKDFWCDSSSSENVTKNECQIQNFSLGIDSIERANQTQCTDFHFENDGANGLTLTEEFLLICDRDYLKTATEISFLAGAGIGSVCSGWISDVYGRKHTLMSFAVVQAVIGSIAAFSTSLAMFMTLRVIIGFASITVVLTNFVLVVELVSGKWRTIIGILNMLPMSITYVLTAGIAYFIRDWRVLQLVTSLTGFPLLLMWYCIPESPRWLLTVGRLDELYVLLERIARFNGQKLPANYQKSLEAAAPNQKTETNNVDAAEADEKPEVVITNALSNAHEKGERNDVAGKVNPWIVAFNKIYLRTTILTLVVWFTLIFVYYGLTLHLANLGGDIYWSTAAVGTAEAISIVASIFIVLKTGIRFSLIVFMLIAGISCLLTNAVPEGQYNLFGLIALAMIAKCVIGANNAIIPTYTAGQYPTEVRNFGIGLGSFASGIALILIPFLWQMKVSNLVPLSIMGACGLIGAAALGLMKDVKE